jgi:tetratricopeptide (TPR) repeat protein
MARPPESAARWLALAERHLAKGASDLARAAARAAATRGPKEGSDWLRLAQVYGRLGDADLARAVLREGASSTNEPGLFAAWADAWPAASAERTLVLQLGADRCPDALDLQVRCVEALLQSGRPGAARARAEHALGRAPTDPRALQAWARVHAASDDAEAAVEALEAALPRLPNPREVVLRLAEHQCRLGRHEAAISLLEAYPEPTAQAERRRVLGIAQRGAGQVDRALESFRAAVRQDPTDGQNHLELARTLLRAGRPEDALVAAQAAQGLEPERADGWIVAGEAELSAGRREGALRAFLKAASRDPDAPDLRERISELMTEQTAGSLSADLANLADVFEKLARREASGHLYVQGPTGEQVCLSWLEGRLVGTDPDGPEPTRTVSGWGEAPQPAVSHEDAIVAAVATALAWPSGQVRFRPGEVTRHGTGVHPAVALAKAARRSTPSA